MLDPTTLLGTIGLLSTEQIDYAQVLLAELGDDLREAARSPKTAEPLIYALLLDAAEAPRLRQLALLEPAVADAARSFFHQLRDQPVDVRLPLAQLALNGLRELDPAGQSHLKFTMKQLAESDAQVTSFEYALQRVISHGLDAAQSPAVHSRDHIYSFGAVGKHTGVFLSALAHAGTADVEAARQAFDAARPQIPLMKSVVLRFVEADQIDLPHLRSSNVWWPRLVP